MSLTRESAYFVQTLPRVFLALETLDPLRLGFRDCHVHRPPFAVKRKTHVSDGGLTRGLGKNLLQKC
jgi:hypothetical protein